MNVVLPYGDGEISLEDESLSKADILLPKSGMPMEDLKRRIHTVLQSANNQESLDDLRRVTSVSILVGGPYSIGPMSLLLECILEHLQSIAISVEKIDVISTYEPGRAYSIDDVSKYCDCIAAEKLSIKMHDPIEHNNCIEIGKTPTECIPLHINRDFAAADYKIALGTIRPSLLVGALGGRTSILPGVSGISTVTQNAKLQASGKIGPYLMDNPASTDMNEACTISGLDLILNTVHDWSTNVMDVVAGNPLQSWNDGVDLTKQFTNLSVNRKYDMVIVGAGGAPTDMTLYDAIDSIYSAYAVSRHNGVIILVSECIDGVGPIGFERGISEHRTEENLQSMIDTDFELGMEKARILGKIRESRELVVCTSLFPTRTSKILDCPVVRDPFEAIEIARGKTGRTASFAIVPYGNWTVIN
ncbi:MAG: lactate racemase domain-containing protein [Candidatus Thorarchaeota archaeon]